MRRQAIALASSVAAVATLCGGAHAARAAATTCPPGATTTGASSATSLGYVDSSVALTSPAEYYQVSAVNSIEGPRSNEACANPYVQALGCP